MYSTYIMVFFRNIFLLKNNTRNKNEAITIEEAEYQRKGQESLIAALHILNTGPWTLEASSSEGDTVYSKVLPGSGKVFRVTATLDLPPIRILKELFHNIEHTTEWNPNFVQVQRLKWIDEQTDIIYQKTTPQLGGLVSSRDFVCLRRWEQLQGQYVTATVSVEHPKAPQSKHVRGWNGPGCWVMQSVPGERNRCRIQWLINTNLQGWLPQSTVDTAFIGFSHSYIELLRAHCRSLTI